MKRRCCRVLQLPEVAFFQEGPGLRTRQWSTEGMKVINVTNILMDGSVDVSNTDKYISLSEFETRYEHFAVSENDIVVASSGNTYGKVGRIRAEHLPLMMNTSVIRFHSKDRELLDDDYLYAFLRSPAFRCQVEAFVTGGAQPNFGPSHLKQMTIRVPALHEQRRVADILSAYDDLIENNRRRMALLEEAARQLYQEWFVRLRFPGHEHSRLIDGVPAGWERVTIGELVEGAEIELQTGPFGTQLKASDYTAEGSPVINVRNIGHGGIRSEKLEYVPEEVVDRLAQHVLKAGDIVFGRKGAVERHVLVGPTQAGWVQGSDCIRLRSLSRRVSTILLSLAFRETQHKEWMLAQCSNKATMASLNQDVLGRICTLLPSDGILREFESTASVILRQICVLEQQSERARTARDLLLPRLTSGEVAV